LDSADMPNSESMGKQLKRDESKNSFH